MKVLRLHWLKILKGQIYVMSVDKDKLDLFEKYCKEENQTVLEWLDERKLKID